jgi:hypothetical protein
LARVDIGKVIGETMPVTCPTCGRDAEPVNEEVDIGVGIQTFLVAWECLEHGGICGVCWGCGIPDRVGETHASWCKDHPGEVITADSFEAETDKLVEKVVERFREDLLSEVERLDKAATPAPWYAVGPNGKQGDGLAGFEREDNGYTIGSKPDEHGWENDSGCPGYSITKEDAEFAARARVLLPLLAKRLKAQLGLVATVRAWANAECGATEADAVLAALAKLDDSKEE